MKPADLSTLFTQQVLLFTTAGTGIGDRPIAGMPLLTRVPSDASR
jgi:hypothetical protein